MLVGEYNYTIDQKGRLALPPKFREHLGKDVVVTCGLERCLWVYPRREWEVWAKKLMKLPLSQANTRAFVRFMLSGARDVAFDRQGRIVIPESLRRYGLIEKRVVAIGLYSKIEIWNESAWQQYREQTEHGSGDIAEKLGELGLGV